jgi:hypothetical protein
VEFKRGDKLNLLIGDVMFDLVCEYKFEKQKSWEFNELRFRITLTKNDLSFSPRLPFSVFSKETITQDFIVDELTKAILYDLSFIDKFPTVEEYYHDCLKEPRYQNGDMELDLEDVQEEYEEYVQESIEFKKILSQDWVDGMMVQSKLLLLPLI